MDNFTSSALISAAILLGAGIIKWGTKLGITTLINTLKELRVAIHELCLDVKGLSVTMETTVKRVEKAEEDIQEIFKEGHNGNYGSYPSKSSNGRK